MKRNMITIHGLSHKLLNELSLGISEELNILGKYHNSMELLLGKQSSIQNKNFVNTVLIVCSYQVTYAFQIESTLHSCLGIKKLLTRSHIWRLNDCSGTRIHNRLVRKRTRNHLAKVAWLNVRLRTKWL